MKSAVRLLLWALLPAAAVLLFSSPANVSTPGVDSALESLQTRLVDLERDNALLRAHLGDFANRTVRTESAVADLSARLAEQDATLAAQAARLDRQAERLDARPVPEDDRPVAGRIGGGLEARVDELADLLIHFRRDGNDVYVEGANLHLRNGAGGTDTFNGLGNLILGYNESRGTGQRRDGSHYLVLGARNEYRGFGGIVAGRDNVATGAWASILGGRAGAASGTDAVVVGGNGNRADGPFAAIVGGVANRSPGEGSVVVGGGFNVTTGRYAVVGGGMRNEASGEVSVVSRGCDTTVATCGGD